MAETAIETGVYENTVGLIERFLEVATADPISALLVLSGALFITAAMGVFGVLTVGGLLSWVSRALPTGGAPARQVR